MTSTDEQRTYLRWKLVEASSESERRVLRSLLSLIQPKRCHVETVPIDVWREHIMTRFLEPVAILAFRYTARCYYKYFAEVYQRRVNDFYFNPRRTNSEVALTIAFTEPRIERPPYISAFTVRKTQMPEAVVSHRQVICYRCGKPGHVSQQCTKPCRRCGLGGHTERRCPVKLV